MSTPTTMTTSTTWDGSSMSQNDLMLKDTVLVLDENDNVIGSASKKKSHEFSSETPRGILHRAFSVFLFDEASGEMLLQQRAGSKITFPNVWTNTCCSHPLHGMSPPEVDSPSDVTAGTVLGAKHAAIRKLNHELGIPSHQLPIENFKFLTRLHYWAADTVTHGKESSPWGEHEIDYVLFIRVKKEELTVKPHPEEVEEVKWVSKEGLVEMMKEGLWSPWFRIIVRKFLIGEGGWWEDLDKTFEREVDETIYRFDPPEEHMGGKGSAGPWLGNLETSRKKQDGSSIQPLSIGVIIIFTTLLLVITSTGQLLYQTFFSTSSSTPPPVERTLFLCFLSISFSLLYILHAKSELTRISMNIPLIPSPLPFLGCVQQFATNSPWNLMTSWHQQYGSIYSFLLLGRNCVAISSPQYLKIILQSKIQTTKKDLPFAYKPFLPLLGKGIVTSEGKEWIRQRLSVSSVLRIRVLEKIPSITYEAVRRLGDKLDGAVRTGHSIELGEELRHLTLQVIAETFFSLDAAECDETFAKMYLPIVEEGNKRVWEPYREYLPILPDYWAYKRNVKKLNDYVSDLIRKRYEERQTDKERKGDVLDHVIDAYEAKREWNEEAVRQLRDEMKTFMLAGHETSAAMMTWAIYELLQNQELIEQVTKEGQGVFGDWDWCQDEDGMPEKEQLAKLTLCEGCLKESLRKYSVVPTVSRRTISPVELGPNTTIPKGTTLFISIQAVHHNPKYYPQPSKFDPTRFTTQKPREPYTFLPFIEGPRNCLGQYLAILESKIVLGMLFQRYELRLAKKVTEGDDPKHRYMVPVIPKEGVDVLVQKKV